METQQVEGASLLRGLRLRSLWNVLAFGMESVLISHIVDGVGLSIGSRPRIAAPDLQGLVLLSLVLNVSTLGAGRTIAGLVSNEE